MSQEQVVEICQLFADRSIDCWLVGGWGVDALLGTQTRAHKDLDVLIRVEDVAMVMRLLEARGFRFAYEWPDQNRWVNEVERIPTAFVMSHDDGSEVDFHAVRFMVDGTPCPEWDTDRSLSLGDLAGTGSIGGITVRCTTPDMQLRDHERYELPSEHARDVDLLRKAFTPED